MPDSRPQAGSSATSADAVTEAGAPAAHGPTPPTPPPPVRTWFRVKAPGRVALTRSIRAAVVMPGVFGLTHVLFANPQVSLFGAFGSFALLLLVDFPGRTRTRLLSYVVLALVGFPFIAVGTVASTHKVAA